MAVESKNAAREVLSDPMAKPLESPASGLRGKRVLITGGLGFIGSNLARECLSQGAEVTIYDCLDPRSGGNMRNVAEIKNDARLVLNDIRNFEGVCTVILNQDVIFNCAAYTSHPHSMKEPYIDIDVNCKGVINVLEAMRRFNPEGKLVHIGTSTQIGRMVGDFVDETHPEFPMDIYSANKSASEKYVMVYGNAYNLRTTVVRLANTYGPRSNIRSPDFGFMNYFIGLALKGKDIPVFGDGSQLRTVAYVEDGVASLIRAAESEKANGQVYFAVGEGQHTVTEIAHAIEEVIGGRVRFVEWPKERGEIEIGDAAIRNTKIRQELGVSFPTGLSSGLALTKEYFQQCLEAYL
jgi:UDP-glucose 4-epimerase